jgi:DNA adenine methylase
MSKLALNKNSINNRSEAKPVLKWAGGKTQLLPVISKFYPSLLGSKIRNYIEPFFGGGAVFFELYNSNLIDEAIIVDNNPDLTVLYKTIQKNFDDLITELDNIQKKYISLGNDDRKGFYYNIRQEFNYNRKGKYQVIDPIRASQIIFLNRTCFNGLFRVNGRGDFNVPHGDHKNPRILDLDNLYEVSKALKIAEILHGDFEDIVPLVRNNTFVYYDPPYRPLSKTSSFNSYSGLFNDEHQIRLSEIFRYLNNRGVKQMLSNSYPINDIGDNFFDNLYRDFNINKVEAKRIINSKSSNRGKIYELLITNYDI